eukprot:TRINITY_DN2829_c0_g1_i1.p1 TRINITY_DN2829_c0_g1~~TRINITY_DN2829_c0_g1_i1.p1  ORF type:complete len:153 (-),score=52.92 TRINITY_DN2829_c0_g1_i1:1047-1505(-)
METMGWCLIQHNWFDLIVAMSDGEMRRMRTNRIRSQLKDQDSRMEFVFVTKQWDDKTLSIQLEGGESVQDMLDKVLTECREEEQIDIPTGYAMVLYYNKDDSGVLHRMDNSDPFGKYCDVNGECWVELEALDQPAKSTEVDEWAEYGVGEVK